MSSCPRRSSRGSRFPRRFPLGVRPGEPSPLAGCAPLLSAALATSPIYVLNLCSASAPSPAESGKVRPLIATTLLPAIEVARHARPALHGGAPKVAGGGFYDILVR